MIIKTLDVSKFKSTKKLREKAKETKKDDTFFPELPEYMRKILKESYARYKQTLNYHG